MVGHEAVEKFGNQSKAGEILIEEEGETVVAGQREGAEYGASAVRDGAVGFDQMDGLLE
jgi:hypothetical protein